MVTWGTLFRDTSAMSWYLASRILSWKEWRRLSLPTVWPIGRRPMDAENGSYPLVCSNIAGAILYEQWENVGNYVKPLQILIKMEVLMRTWSINDGFPTAHVWLPGTQNKHLNTKESSQIKSPQPVVSPTSWVLGPPAECFGLTQHCWHTVTVAVPQCFVDRMGVIPISACCRSLLNQLAFWTYPDGSPPEITKVTTVL